MSSATKHSPYEIVFGRLPILPIDLIFETANESVCASSPEEYVKDLRIQLRDILSEVNDNLEVSRKKMMQQYNRNKQFYDYRPNEMVWLKKKTFKPGESKKLAPRKTGPWCVLRKLPNGVNFEIRDPKSKIIKIVHHNRLSPAMPDSRKGYRRRCKKITAAVNKDLLAKSGACTSDSEYSDSDSNDPVLDDQDPTENDAVTQAVVPRRYPERNPVPRVVEGAVSWDDVNI